MITIILDKGEVYTGKTIKGNIELVPDTEMYINDIELCLYYIEEWIYSKSEEKKDKRNNKQCVSLLDLGVNKFLPEGDNNLIHLSPILHLFPFEIKLPENIYPSFEYPKHDFCAYLRYSLYAKVKSPNVNLSTTNLIFIYAVSRRDNSSFKIENSFNIKKWGMFGKGATNINATFPMKYYRFSDNIPIKMNIDNTLGKMKVNLVKISLKRKMILKDNKDENKEKYSRIDKILKKIFKVDVKSGNQGIYDFVFPLSEIPAEDFSYFDNVNLYNWTKKYCEFMPSIESTILSCQYILKITIYYDSFIKKSNRPKIKIPIYIVHKLNDNIKVPIQNTITNKAEETSEEEIKKHKEDDFIIFNKNIKSGEIYETPQNSDNLNRSKTNINNNNNSYIENMIYNNKNNNQMNIKTPLSSHNLDIYNNSKINNNKIDNQISEIQDEGEAPTYQLFNQNNNKIEDINNSEDKNNNMINNQNDINMVNKPSKNYNNINEIDD